MDSFQAYQPENICLVYFWISNFSSYHCVVLILNKLKMFSMGRTISMLLHMCGRPLLINIKYLMRIGVFHRRYFSIEDEIISGLCITVVCIQCSGFMISCLYIDIAALYLLINDVGSLFFVFCHNGNYRFWHVIIIIIIIILWLFHTNSQIIPDLLKIL